MSKKDLVKGAKRCRVIAVPSKYIKNSKGKTCIDCVTEIRNEKLFGKND